MSNNLKIGLMGTIAAVLVVAGYLVYNQSSGTSTNNSASIGTGDTAGQTATTTTSNDGKSNFTVNGGDATVTKTTTPVEPAFTGPRTVMAFGNTDHDFGQIDQQTENEYIFKFTNTGTEPLVISKAKGSCGCTVPEYPKEPIAPGEDGEIKVVYKPGKQKNKQTKRVTVTANTEPEQTVLTITAEVQEIAAAQ